MKMKKLLAIGIIFLFIGAAVAPSINFTVVKASDDNDLVEVTSQACGIQGFGNTTVKLTKQQYHDLEQYLVDFRARLNQTASGAETVRIFKEAIVELNKYGLLPKGMSIKQAQTLVTNNPLKHAGSRLLEPRLKRTQPSQNKVDNLFCLVAGETNNNYIFGPIKSSLFVVFLLAMDIVEIIAEILDSLGLERVVNFLLMLDDFLDSMWIPVRVIPAEIGGIVTFGDYYYEWEVGPHYTTSSGWVNALGLRGAQSVNGTFYGTIREGFLGFYWGLIGYTGIVLRPRGTGKMIFIGSALQAKLSPDHL
ncbi:MAG TPA: hypothetical protein VMT57_09180 [Candidatus Thermoplasmatota archaeon]|nr:hypothetical protein [Candidatus Thermoplasmatota archaeon]